MATSSGNDPANDPSRRPPKSSDPAWKYGFYPDLTNKDRTHCMLCQKEMSGGACRLKKHLVGDFKDVTKCPNTTTEITAEMKASIADGKRKKDNEWVNGEIIDDSDGEFWNVVDIAVDASQGIENRRNSRRGETQGNSSSSQPSDSNDIEMVEYANQDQWNDDEDVDDDYGCMDTMPTHENAAELETNEVELDDLI